MFHTSLKKSSVHVFCLQVTWRIYGPNNPQSALQATNDIAFVSGSQELTSGTLTWPDGQAGEKTFSLDIKPFTSWEIEKTFVIKLEKIQGSPTSVGHGEISPTSGSVALTVRLVKTLFNVFFWDCLFYKNIGFSLALQALLARSFHCKLVPFLKKGCLSYCCCSHCLHG